MKVRLSCSNAAITLWGGRAGEGGSLYSAFPKSRCTSNILAYNMLPNKIFHTVTVFFAVLRARNVIYFLTKALI